MSKSLTPNALRRERIRKWWRGNINNAHNRGFSDSVTANITSDSEQFKDCWCCGAFGYQEIAHITASSLGGCNRPENLFLLCDECHVASPDHRDECHFVEWVNANEGRTRALMLSNVEANLRRIVKAYSHDLVYMEAAKNAFIDILKGQKGDATQHAANTSPSTIRACLTSATDELFNLLPAPPQ